ncbi:YARHG domain-containing protein [Flavobacterium ginsengiterrae]|uniref:YARHG domain-containing protein n=1 Tax=Flavobacterium ginsengiterrae TaxID=871695 RepID=A0ABP7H679_9FLAO
MNRIALLFILFNLTSNAQTLKDCSACAVKIIKTEQIKDLSIDEIRLLSNEIFARNGYQFENSRFQNYFETKSWYKSIANNKSIVLKEIEKQNIKILQDQTKLLKAEQEELINQLKTLKKLVLTNQTDELKSKFGFVYEQQYGSENAELLKKVFNKINLDDINYYKSNGLNSVMTDNGFVKIVYELAIEKREINLYYNYMSHSKIIEGFDEFNDYHSEDEYMYNWQFEFKNNKLKFIRLAIAG